MGFPYDSLIAAAFLFEQQNGRKLEALEAQEIEEAGFSHSSAKEIAQAIWAALDEDQPDTYRITAYWALGKLYSKENLPRFQEALRRELKLNSKVVYQLLIALDNLGEPVFSRSEGGIAEHEANLRDAYYYLHSLKSAPPN